MKYQTVYDKSWIEKNVQPGQQLHFGHTKYLMVFGIRQVLNLYQNIKKSKLYQIHNSFVKSKTDLQ